MSAVELLLSLVLWLRLALLWPMPLAMTMAMGLRGCLHGPTVLNERATTRGMMPTMMLASELPC